jgi:hypothetical protein
VKDHQFCGFLSKASLQFQSEIQKLFNGRAANAPSNYKGHPAYTIHKHIYQRVARPNGQLWFDLKDNQTSDTVFFVDEACMISDASGDLHEDWKGLSQAIHRTTGIVQAARTQFIVSIYSQQKNEEWAGMFSIFDEN